MNFKKNLAIIISLLLVLNLVPFVSFSENLTQFRDMPTNGSTEALERAVKNELLIGYNNMIMPDDHLTRAQMATIINRAFGGDQKVTLDNFDDVNKDAWYYEELQKAVQKKLFIGDGNNKFRPSDKITKEEAYVVVGRLFKISSGEHDLLEKFVDHDKINDWSKNEIAGLVASNYIDVTGTINSDDYITRAEFAVLMDQLVKQYIKSPGTYTTIEEGNVVVNTSGVTLKDVVISGDLIIGDGVDSGEFTLDNTQVLGRVIVRGGGENSIFIKGDSEIQSIIITKVDGIVRFFSEKNILIEEAIMEGSDDVVLEGKFRSVKILSDNITVHAKNTYINRASIEGHNSRLIVDSESDIDHLDIWGNTIEVTGEGNVDKIFAYGKDVSIKTQGTLVTAVEGSNNIDADGVDVREGKTVLTGAIEEKSTDSTNKTSSKPNVSTPSKVSTPSATPSGGTVNAGEEVSLSSATDGAELYYTLDGSLPTMNSTQYTDKILINESLTLKAIAVKSGWVSSNILTETYVVSEESSEFAGGNGTQDNPYQVATAEQLDKVREYLDAHFIQIADIDLGVSPWNEGEGWEPIGNWDSDTRFRGSYDGDDFIINNLTINNPSHSYIGLFGVVGHYSTSSEIKNITLTNISISGDSLHTVGGLAGITESTTEINNCNSDGTINSNSLSGYAVGGLIGYNNGHLVNSSSTVEANINSSSESHTSKIGGLVGDNGGTIESCFYSGNVTGKEYVGGLAGWNGSGNILKSYSTGNINGHVSVGGIAGLSHGLIEECYSYSNVIGTSAVGGTVGNLTSTIINSYSLSSTSGDSSIGGLVGTTTNNRAEIINCYSTGIVSSPSINKGGLLGTIDFGSSVTNSYWDTETSGLGTSAGGTGYSTDFMIKFANSVPIYETWDFEEIWTMTEGETYPYLLNNTQVPAPRPQIFEGGTGTLGDPYQIKTAKQLDNVRYCLDSHFIQIANIDLSSYLSGLSEGWDPIGNQTYKFTGSYNGNDYSIGNLMINRPTAYYQGLFGAVEQGAELKNIVLNNPTIVGDEYIGALAGRNDGDVTSCSAIAVDISCEDMYSGGLIGMNTGTVFNSSTTGILKADYSQHGGLIGYNYKNETEGYFGTINNCFSEVSITYLNSDEHALETAGGLIGYNSNGTVTNSYATGSVTGYDTLGGLIGDSSGGEVDNCYASGNITAVASYDGYYGYYFGGLIGESSSQVKNSYANGTVTGIDDVGGLIGSSSKKIENSHASGNVTGIDSVGGLVGNNNAEIYQSYAQGKTTGSNDVGGLAGRSYQLITESYALGDIQTNGTGDAFGGLVGTIQGSSSDNPSKVSNCYAVGNVNGTSEVGGLIGYISVYGEVTNTYAVGSVNGSSAIGGLIGAISSDSIIEDSYYDMENTGSNDTNKGIPLTTVEMIDQSSYENWDFDENSGIWAIDLSERTYPYFQWQTNNIPYAIIEEPDLLGYWDFNEGSGAIAYDQSTYTNDGTIVGATWTEDMNSTTDAALTFGTNKWVDIPDTIKPEKITLAAWIYITGTDNDPRPIFSAETGSGASGFAYRLQITSDQKLRMEAVAPYSTSGARVSTSENTLNLNQWYHVVGTYDGIKTKLYLDGELIQSDDHGSALSLKTGSSIPVGIGHLPNWSVQWFRGTIDEPRIYDGALTSKEIQELL